MNKPTEKIVEHIDKYQTFRVSADCLVFSDDHDTVIKGTNGRFTVECYVSKHKRGEGTDRSEFGEPCHVYTIYTNNPNEVSELFEYCMMWCGRIPDKGFSKTVNDACRKWLSENVGVSEVDNPSDVIDDATGTIGVEREFIRDCMGW